jgi:hypothetical protein
MSDKPLSLPLSRRQALGLIAASAGGGVFLPGIALAQQASPYAGLALFGSGAGVCAITPEATEGPFYFDPKLQRADITERKAGIALNVRLQVVDAGCRPLARASTSGIATRKGIIRAIPDKATARMSIPQARVFCAVGKRPTTPASSRSPPSIPAGIAAAPPISTSRSSPTTIR